MKALRFLVSLVTNDNDYQREQAHAVVRAASRLGVEAKVTYAEGDAINQGQQLLKAIQAAPNLRPDAIICLPVGTGLTQVAQSAVAAGIGWAIINRDVDYLSALRASSQVPCFCITVDQKEVGRIQARHIAALLPNGGSVLYVQGPSGNFSAEQRTLGLQSGLPANVQLRMIRGRFTEESGYHAVKSLLTLSTSRQAQLDLVCAQNDDMALGARRALLEEGALRPGLQFTGCDACGEIGQERVRKGTLAASILLPFTAEPALETFVRSYREGVPPPGYTLLRPASFPPEDQLKAAVDLEMVHT